MERDDGWSWEIGGWADDRGHHFNCEEGDRRPDGDDLPDVEYLQVHVTNDEGFDSWVTLRGPWEADDWDLIDDWIDEYIDHDGMS